MMNGIKNFKGDKIMEWYDIVFELLNDEMIKSCGCDGLWDSYRTLNGLLGMVEIMDISDEFILEGINASIRARNRYCCLNGAKKLGYVSLENGEFIWG